MRPTASDVLAALESDQCMRLLMGVDIHDKMYPRSAVLWWGEPSNQEDELGPLPQQVTSYLLCTLLVQSARSTVNIRMYVCMSIGLAGQTAVFVGDVTPR